MTVAVVIFGLGPPVMKLVRAPALAAMSVRFWMAAPLLCAIALLSGRGLSWAILRKTALPGVVFGLNLPFVFMALQHTSVAVVAVVLSLQPGVVLLVASRWMGETTTRWHVSWTAAGVVGVAIVVAGGTREVHGDALGVVFAAAALLTFSGYYLMNRKVRSTTPIDPIQWMAGVTLVAALTVTPLVFITLSVDDFRQINGADWLYLGFLAVILGIVGHGMMSWVHRYMGASQSSLFLLSMNVVSVGAAWPINGESVSLLQLVGGLLVLATVAAVVSRPVGELDVATPIL
jgi:drug/metabolite transporter (DMT)-like permease